MLLGKRTRHPMKRTTSMTGITVDVVSDNVELEDSIVVQLQHPVPIISDDPQTQNHLFPTADLGFSPRNPGPGGGRSNHVLHGTSTTAPFLRSCCLCKRRLAPGRDIYMYRGDAAFCSLECREQQMKQDERREKSNFLASKKGDRHSYA